MKTNHIGIISGITLLAILVFFSVYIFRTNEKGEYDFTQPEKTYVLSDSLKEVSGLTVFNKKMLGCVEDEHGIVYLFDLEEGHIKRKLEIEPMGDFEAIARVGKEVCLLRSDGTLFVRSTKKKSQKVDQYRLPLPHENYEGLFYQKSKNRLLIVSRASDQHKKGVPVYAFELNTKQLKKEPAFFLQLSENEREKVVFEPSELAFHPVNGNLYVLSAADHAIFVFTDKGKLVYIQQLNPTIFNKPEGMAFAKNGDLFISNEGQTEKPTIQKFVWLH